MLPQPPERKTFNLQDVRATYLEKLRDSEMILGLTNALEDSVNQITELKKEIAALKGEKEKANAAL